MPNKVSFATPLNLDALRIQVLVELNDLLECDLHPALTDEDERPGHGASRGQLKIAPAV
jgi:hypothetical protein